MQPQRKINELINTDEPAWPLVQEWIASATNQVKVLPLHAQNEDVLLHLQVTTRSPMGAIAYECGGILVDHGWLRILGSGHPNLQATMKSANSNLRSHVVVAQDAVGGVFALNGGGLSTTAGTAGKVFYFAPDTLAWECTDQKYSDFLNWAFNGPLEQFYADYRWEGWQAELDAITGNEGFSLFPFPFTAEGKDPARRSRKVIPMAELISFYFNFKI